MNIHGKQELLLVDDEPRILSALTRLFRRKGYTSLSAKNGEDAIKILEENPLPVVISDMKMPGMSGSSFLTIVSERWPSTIRIALTGHVDIQDTIDAINDAGVFQYISKPWDDNTLIDIVESAFKKYQQHQDTVELHAQGHKQTQELLSEKIELEREIRKKSESLVRASDQLANAYEDEKKLRRAQQEAESLNEAKSRFLASMSHEMRSPLNAIISMNALLLESDLNDGQKDLAKLAYEGGQTLLSLINDILDFSKIEAGKLEINPRWFKLVPLIEKISELLSSQTINKPVEICTVIAENTPGEIYTDDVRLKQVLINIISNAIKFTEKGGIHIKVSPLKAGVQICIKDTGIGISQADQVHIFEDFFQVNNNDRMYGGSGLGLSICKQLVKLMKGHISVTSEVGRGSCFRIYIPVETRKTIDLNPFKQSRRLVFLDTKNHILFNCIRDQLCQLNCEVLSHYNISQVNSNKSYASISERFLFHDANQHVDSQSYISSLNDSLHKKNIDIDFKGFKQISLISNDGANQISKLQPLGYTNILRKPLRLSKLIETILSTEQELPSTLEHDNQISRQRVKDAPESKNPPLTILLVEDSPANQAVVKAILADQNYLIDIAVNGLEAVNISKKTRYDIILMDVSMPIMNGIEATKKIRICAGPNQDTKIIAMTANAFSEDRDKCMLAGMNDFLSKPIDVDEFLTTLKNYQEVVEKRQNIAINEKALINPQVLKQLINDTSLNIFPKILDIYINETNNRIPKMLSQCQQQQWSELADEAHTLKSSSGSYGACALQEKAEKIEKMIKENDIDSSKEEMSNIEELARESICQLKTFYQEVKMESSNGTKDI